MRKRVPLYYHILNGSTKIIQEETIAHQSTTEFLHSLTKKKKNSLIYMILLQKYIIYNLHTKMKYTLLH